MPDNPLSPVLKELANHMKTVPLDLEQIRRRQRELVEQEIESSEPEPGQPEFKG